MRKARIAGASALVAVAVLALAAPASADHHFMKIREFFPGTTANTRHDAFLELQMYAAGQNVVGGQGIDVYANGPDTLADHYVLSVGNVANGENQRTVLIGGSLVTDRDKAEEIGTSYDSVGGALCFASTTFGTIDCVEWGTGNDTVNAGSPVSPAGITAGNSITRSIAPGCSTLLEAGDDTDDSAVDFAESAPSPRNNSTTPTEHPCDSATEISTGFLTQPPPALPPIAAAIKKCKKKFPKGPKRKKCIRKAKQRAAAA